nr:MAG TPA: Lysis protein [Caudoviricetes sp.]
MRRIFMVGVSAVASILLMAGCNKQVIDLTYEYSQAQIKMPDGTVIEGKVDSWNDYEGDQLQVKINGTTYLVHSSNVVLWNGTKTKPGEKVASRE